MALRKSHFLSLGVFLLLPGPAVAAEESATGMSVARELVAHEGHRFLFTVTPPPNRAVDPRVFEMFELEDEAEKGGSFVRKEKDVEPEAEAVNVSGYLVRIEDVGVAASSCRIQVPLVKFKKAKLEVDRYFRVQATGAAAMFVSSFGTKGDVDTGIFRGPETTGTLCSKSTKGAGQLDLAKCSQGSCGTTGEVLTGVIVNFTSSDAEFVGAVTVSFAQ